MVYKFGPMVPNSKDFGSTIKQKDTAGSFSQTGTFIKDPGSETKLTVKASTSTQKAPLIKGAGTKTSKKEMEKKSGQMDHSITDSTSEARSTGKEFFSGQMVPNSTVTGKTTKCMVKAKLRCNFAQVLFESCEVYK